MVAIRSTSSQFHLQILFTLNIFQLKRYVNKVNSIFHQHLDAGDVQSSRERQSQVIGSGGNQMSSSIHGALGPCERSEDTMMCHSPAARKSS